MKIGVCYYSHLGVGGKISKFKLLSWIHVLAFAFVSVCLKHLCSKPPDCEIRGKGRVRPQLTIVSHVSQAIHILLSRRMAFLCAVRMLWGLRDPGLYLCWKPVEQMSFFLCGRLSFSQGTTGPVVVPFSPVRWTSCEAEGLGWTRNGR